MSESTFDASVVIPCLNEEDYIQGCVESVFKSAAQATKRVEVIVVDGESDDRTPQILQQLEQEYSDLIRMENPKKVTPISLNLGIKRASAPIVIILGAHANVASDFIESNLQVLVEHPEAACVGGVIENKFDGKNGEIFEIALTSAFGVGNARFRTGGEAGFVDTVAFGAYRKEVFNEIGYFDERLVRNQDDEFNYRLLKHGRKIFFDPRIRSIYFVRTEIKKLSRQYFQYGYWKVFVNMIHRRVTTWRQLAPFVLVTSILLYPILVCLALIFDTRWLSYPSLAIALEMVVYFFSLLVVSWANTDSFRGLNRLRRVFWTLHWNYGLGYLYGVIDFVILRKQPKENQTELTR